MKELKFKKPGDKDFDGGKLNSAMLDEAALWAVPTNYGYRNIDKPLDFMYSPTLTIEQRFEIARINLFKKIDENCEFQSFMLDILPYYRNVRIVPETQIKTVFELLRDSEKIIYDGPKLNINWDEFNANAKRTLELYLEAGLQIYPTPFNLIT